MQDIAEICRLCLETSTEQSHQIFDECLNNKIVIITGLDLLPSVDLPNIICKNCRYQLEKSYYFRIVAKQSDTRLRKYVRLRNQNKDAGYLLEKEYKDDDIEEFDESLLESYNYFDEIHKQIEIEKKAAIKQELNLLRIRQQKKQIKKPRGSSRNIQEKPIVLLNKVPDSTVPEPEIVPTLRRKRKAAENVLAQQYPIDIGEVELIDGQQFEIEILPEGSTDEVQLFEIKGTSEQFEIIEEVEQVPVEKKKDQKPKFIHQDTATEYYFKTLDETEVKPEVDANGEKKIFQCAFENCSETFSRRQQCKTHYYNHLATSSPFACQYCSKRFKVASALERHERVHNNSKPFICGTCSKGFSQKEMLKRHLQIHLPIDEAKFACKICNKRFRQKDPLRQHMLKMHTDSEAPKFQCNLCEKSFAHSSGLSRHLLIHSGKMFSCEVCKRQFTDKSALKRHGAIHTKSENN